MSSLSLTLLILVLLGVGGVAFYNFWVLRGQSRSLTNRLIDDLDDRPAASRPEPSLVMGDSDVPPADHEPAYAMPGPAPPGDRFHEPFASASFSPGSAQRSDDDMPRPAVYGDSEPRDAWPEPVLAPPTEVDRSDVGHEEPTAPPVASAATAVSAAPARPEATAADRGVRATPVAPAVQAASPPDRFHCELCIPLPEPQAGERLMRLTRDMGRVGAKPVEIAACPVSGESPGFGPLHEDERYDAIRYRLLLINRQGPLNAMEFSEFANHLQKLSDELDVLVDTPQMNEVLGRARELDERVGSLDAQIAVNVETGVAISIDEFARAAARLGLKEQANQRYVRVDDRGEPVYSVALPDEPNRIVLLLDVPRVARSRQPIREMIETAWKLAQTFDGRMVDDSGQPIDNALFERIENQLDTLYQALEATGLPAGSALARRVFNL